MILIPSHSANAGDWIWIPCAGQYIQITDETVEAVRECGLFLCWRVN